MGLGGHLSMWRSKVNPVCLPSRASCLVFEAGCFSGLRFSDPARQACLFSSSAGIIHELHLTWLFC